MTKFFHVTTTHISGQLRVVQNLLYIILEVARICVYNSRSMAASFIFTKMAAFTCISFAYPSIEQVGFRGSRIFLACSHSLLHTATIGSLQNPKNFGSRVLFQECKHIGDNQYASQDDCYNSVMPVFSDDTQAHYPHPLHRQTDIRLYFPKFLQDSQQGT